MLKNKVLFLFTNHRVAEKLWEVIPALSLDYEIDILLVGLFSSNTPWVGDIDERMYFLDKYKPYITNIIQGPGIRYHGDTVKKSLSDYVNVTDYQFVIYDDNRKMQEYKIPEFYNVCKKHNVYVFGNSHGNEDRPHNEIGVSYDYLMNFENGGIPTNDLLRNAVKQSNHLLIITNFLSNRNSIFPINFDRFFVENCGILELSRYYNLPIVVKIKTRLDKRDYVSDINYVQSILDCNVVVNTTDIDTVISNSALIISAPSTLCFKPIQLGIPTVLIRGAGAIGSYRTFPGLVDLNKQLIYDNIQKQIEHGKYSEFIQQTLKGGDTFESTIHYIKHLHKVLHENNIQNI